MIFKKRSSSQDQASNAEPPTRVKPFPGTEEVTSSPLKNRFKDGRIKIGTGRKETADEGEPPTRDAVFAMPTDMPSAAQRMVNHENPPVGFLVIIEGPGRGYTAPLTAGTNTIGRAENLHICLDFGDEEMSADQHASIVYDSEKRGFYLDNASKEAPTFIGEQAVGARRRKLKHRDRLKMGATTLLFLPVCNDGFDWDTA